MWVLRVARGAARAALRVRSGAQGAKRAAPGSPASRELAERWGNPLRFQLKRLFRYILILLVMHMQLSRHFFFFLFLFHRN